MLTEIIQIKCKEIKGLWADSMLSCQPQMQIWCSQLFVNISEELTKNLDPLDSLEPLSSLEYHKGQS